MRSKEGGWRARNNPAEIFHGYHGIVEWFGSEGTLKHILIPSPPPWAGVIRHGGTGLAALSLSSYSTGRDWGGKSSGSPEWEAGRLPAEPASLLGPRRGGKAEGTSAQAGPASSGIAAAGIRGAGSRPVPGTPAPRSRRDSGSAATPPAPPDPSADGG